jgi:hypothetical protein
MHCICFCGRFFCFVFGCRCCFLFCHILKVMLALPQHISRCSGVPLPASCLCSICSEPLLDAVALAPCHHTLCRACSVKLLASSRRCPFCRSNIDYVARSYTVSSIVEDLMQSDVCSREESERGHAPADFCTTLHDRPGPYDATSSSPDVHCPEHLEMLVSRCSCFAPPHLTHHRIRAIVEDWANTEEDRLVDTILSAPA